jgi:hypothetical protein
MTTEAIDAFNKWGVSSNRGRIHILNISEVMGGLSCDDALMLSAWLVSMAEPFAERSFGECLEAVRSG